MKDRAKKPRETLTHFDADGRARIVDVGDKPVTQRRAVAAGRLSLSTAGWRALSRPDGAGKGDPLSVAQIAAVQAAKRTSDWIPMTHPLPLDAVAVEWKRRAKQRVLEIQVEVACQGRTGVEMEALTAASAALLTVYDMLKAVDRRMVLGPVWLRAKTGGSSGDVAAEDPPL